MKLLFLTNVPSPYRVDFFNELGKYCDLTVLFEKRTSSERDDSWKDYKFNTFRGVFLKGKSISVDSAFCSEVIRYVKDPSFDNIICSNVSSPTGMFAIQYMKLHHIEYYIEADGGTAKSGKGLKEIIKKHFISDAKGYFSTSASCDNYFITYGAEPQKIYRYPFTSLLNEDVLDRPLTDAEKRKLRAKLGIEEEKVIISVGRFSYLNGYGKGYDTLLHISEELVGNNIGIYIIGDEPTEEFKKWKEEKNLSHVHFLPFKKKKELFEYYRASDLSVLLSRGEAWGLVINESMANGVPVIATDACVGALELIENNKNGYIVSVNDVNGTKECIDTILCDKATGSRFANESIKTVRSYTIEKMAREHCKVLSEDML